MEEEHGLKEEEEDIGDISDFLPKKPKLNYSDDEETSIVETNKGNLLIDEEEEADDEEEEIKEADEENIGGRSIEKFLSLVSSQRKTPNDTSAATHNFILKSEGAATTSSTTAESPPLSSIFSAIAAAASSAAAATSSSSSGKYSCNLCPNNKKLIFDNCKMLQQHNQNFHTDKQFVCEICGKAFRFRSNLAEHRSVHTAVKPFVCRFCGKSSRLKGNLTKHILKHHKKEQNDYIGTDDIIIKKGKKSVKDPAAIDFLEKSMIVLNGGNGGGSGSGGSNANPESGSGSVRAASVAESLSGSSTPMGILNAPSVEEQQRCFLMSLGLTPGSIDLKAESPDSDSSSGSQARTTNDQLLEQCNAYAAMDVDNLNGISGGNNNGNDGGMGGGGRNSSGVITEDFLSQFAAANNNSLDHQQHSSHVNAAVATLANLVAANNNNNSIQQHRNNGIPSSSNSGGGGGGGLRGKLNFGNFGSSGGNFDDSSNIGETISRVASSFTPNSMQSGSGTTTKKTQCPECGKHMRKPKDLVTHLTMIHRFSPDDIANLIGDVTSSESPTIISNLPNTSFNTTTSSSSGGGGGGTIGNLSSGFSDYGSSALTTELKNLQKSLNELKAQRNVSHLTQAVNNLDTRMGRLEKQLEMVLNTLYTLVQLQASGPINKAK